MTARALFHRCRRLGIQLTAKGDGITFDAPAGVAVPVDDMRRCKCELFAVLLGDYFCAALALVLEVDDPARQEALAYLFDERTGIHEYDGDMSRGEALRQAYIDLARALDMDAELGYTLQP